MGENSRNRRKTNILAVFRIDVVTSTDNRVGNQMMGGMALAISLDHSTPAQIVWKIFRGDASERCHPALQPARVRVDVLDMKAIPHAFVASCDDANMRDRAGLCEPLEALATICDQHHAGGDHRIERLIESLPVEFTDDPIVRRFVAVTCDENNVVVLSGRAGFFGITPTFPGYPAKQIARTLLRFADQGLVSFDNTGEDRRSLIPRGSEETMSPTKRRVEADVRAPSSLSEADAIDDRAGVLQPGVASMKLRERRSGQSIERSRAVPASISTQSTGSAPGANPIGATMPTRRISTEARVDQAESIRGVGRLQRRRQRGALHVRQLAQAFDKCLEL